MWSEEVTWFHSFCRSWLLRSKFKYVGLSRLFWFNTTFFQMNMNSWLILYYYNFASCVFLLQTKNETIVEAGESSMARDLNYTHYYKVWSNLILTAIVPIGGHHVLLNSWVVKWVTWLNFFHKLLIFVK